MLSWASSRIEWSPTIVWMWAWKVLVSWWSGVAPSWTYVSSCHNSRSSLSHYLGGWLSGWWRDCSSPWWLYCYKNRTKLFWIYLDHLQGCLVGRMVFSFPTKIKVLPIPFPYFCLVTIFACWIFSLHLLKERKRKSKKFPFLTMLVVLLVLSQRLILIFQHGSMMCWILMERIVPCLWLGQSMCQMFLGLIQCVLECSVLCPYFLNGF